MINLLNSLHNFVGCGIGIFFGRIIRHRTADSNLLCGHIRHNGDAHVGHTNYREYKKCNGQYQWYDLYFQTKTKDFGIYGTNFIKKRIFLLFVFF